MTVCEAGQKPAPVWNGRRREASLPLMGVGLQTAGERFIILSYPSLAAGTQNCSLLAICKLNMADTTVLNVGWVKTAAAVLNVVCVNTDAVVLNVGW
jgi:hypothetical protein